MSALTPEPKSDWTIDTNYPCMGREIRPDSLVGILDAGGDLVMALPLEDAEIVIERITSLRAQLTAREQERLGDDMAFATICHLLDESRNRSAAAEAEVERQTEKNRLARKAFFLRRSHRSCDCEDCQWAERYMDSLTVAAPSQPPQTTAEKEDWLVFERESQLFWRPEAKGYTQFIGEAGRFTKAKAESYAANPSRHDVAVHESDAAVIVSTRVPPQTTETRG